MGEHIPEIPEIPEITEIPEIPKIIKIPPLHGHRGCRMQPWTSSDRGNIPEISQIPEIPRKSLKSHPHSATGAAGAALDLPALG